MAPKCNDRSEIDIPRPSNLRTLRPSTSRRWFSSENLASPLAPCAESSKGCLRPPYPSLTWDVERIDDRLHTSPFVNKRCALGENAVKWHTMFTGMDQVWRARRRVEMKRSAAPALGKRSVPKMKVFPFLDTALRRSSTSSTQAPG